MVDTTQPQHASRIFSADQEAYWQHRAGRQRVFSFLLIIAGLTVFTLAISDGGRINLLNLLNGVMMLLGGLGMYPLRGRPGFATKAPDVEVGPYAIVVHGSLVRTLPWQHIDVMKTRITDQRITLQYIRSQYKDPIRIETFAYDPQLRQIIMSHLTAAPAPVPPAPG
jgi:hypothetical protein